MIILRLLNYCLFKNKIIMLLRLNNIVIILKKLYILYKTIKMINNFKKNHEKGPKAPQLTVHNICFIRIDLFCMGSK